MNNKQHKPQKWIILATILIMAFIFAQSALPADLSSAESDPIAIWLSGIIHTDEDTASFIIRKLGHFSEYAVLGLFLLLTVRAWMPESVRERFRRRSGKNRSEHTAIAVTAWIIGTLYAVTDEVHQIFVEGRSCEFRDICIDAAGVLLGVLIMSAICFREKRVSAGDGSGEKD